MDTDDEIAVPCTGPVERPVPLIDDMTDFEGERPAPLNDSSATGANSAASQGSLPTDCSVASPQMDVGLGLLDSEFFELCEKEKDVLQMHLPWFKNYFAAPSHRRCWSQDDELGGWQFLPEPVTLWYAGMPRPYQPDAEVLGLYPHEQAILCWLLLNDDQFRKDAESMLKDHLHWMLEDKMFGCIVGLVLSRKQWPTLRATIMQMIRKQALSPAASNGEALEYLRSRCSLDEQAMIDQARSSGVWPQQTGKPRRACARDARGTGRR